MKKWIDILNKKFIKKEKMVIPTGLTFKLLVKPKLTKEHQKGLSYGIINKSGLSRYYKIVDIGFFENFKDKQMLIKVFCPESIVAVEQSKENAFYTQMKEKFSEWIINTLKDSKYDCKLYEFNHTVKII